jgi:transcriptional regulator with XRE-family HTH domain
MSMHPVDVYVGKKLRLFRLACDMSQEVLGVAVGVTFQQIQKYEKGNNRIGASRLYQFAKVLNVSVSSFFEGFQEKTDAQCLNDDDTKFEYTYTSNQEKEQMEMVHVFQRIDPKLRLKILAFLRSLANMNNTSRKQATHPSPEPKNRDL